MQEQPIGSAWLALHSLRPCSIGRKAGTTNNIINISVRKGFEREELAGVLRFEDSAV
jgi:hypothetical protein